MNAASISEMSAAALATARTVEIQAMRQADASTSSLFTVRLLDGDATVLSVDTVDPDEEQLMSEHQIKLMTMAVLAVGHLTVDTSTWAPGPDGQGFTAQIAAH